MRFRSRAFFVGGYKYVLYKQIVKSFTKDGLFSVFPDFWVSCGIENSHYSY